MLVFNIFKAINTDFRDGDLYFDDNQIRNIMKFLEPDMYAETLKNAVTKVDKDEIDKIVASSPANYQSEKEGSQ
jgi:hypothetical protein